MAILPWAAGRGFSPDEWAADELWMPQRMAAMVAKTRIHVAVQALDPQTLAYASVDSTTGTSAWLWKRRRAWSDCGGDVEAALTKDGLVTGATIYWLTRTLGTSMRLYFDQLARPWSLSHGRTAAVKAPTGLAIFPKDNM